MIEDPESNFRRAASKANYSQTCASLGASLYCLPAWSLAHAEAGPRISIHVSLQRFLPAVLPMRAQMFCRLKVFSARMTRSGGERHIGDHAGVSSLVLN